jgi:uncharacterized membrane protein YqjE
MAEAREPDAGGLLASVKSMAANLLAIAQTRLELLASDVAEERERLTTLLVLVLLALFSFGVGVVLLALLIVIALWESNRLLALGGLTGFFMLAGALLGWLAMNKLRRAPRLFDASISELQKDRDQLEAKP